MMSMRGMCSKALLLFVVGGLLGPAGGCGVGGGQRIGLPEGGALRPSRLAYAVTPEAGTVVPGLGAIEIPPSVDLRREGIVPPVQNQVFNSCVGWSIGYFVMSGVLAREMRGYGKYLDMQKCENWFSPEFLYSQRDAAPGRVDAVAARRAAGDPIRGLSRERDGDVAFMRPEEALVALFEHGICPWSWLSTTEGDPEHLGCASSEDAPGTAGMAPVRSRAPWQYATIMAKHFRPRCYVRFGELDDLAGGTARRLRAWLADEGTPIAAVLQMSGGWVRYRGDDHADATFVDPCGVTRTEPRAVCRSALGDPMTGAHMMTLIGYDATFPASAATPDIPEDLRGSFLFINQWGTKWGDQGTMWIPATELEKVWIAGYGIIGDDGSEFEFGNPETAQKPLCFQDETGKYIGISSDGNDVPANLLTAAERCALREFRQTGTIDGFEPDDDTLVATLDPTCEEGIPVDEGDVARVSVVNTACRITWPGTGTTLTRAGAVGGQPTGDSLDTADWFWFDVPATDVPTGSVPLRALVTDGAGGPCLPLELKITNAAYEEVSVPAGAGDCAVVTRLGAGRHFVKVAIPSPRVLSGPVAYTLTLEIGAHLPTEAPAMPIPYAERCLDLGVVAGKSLDGVPAGPGTGTEDVQDLYWIDDVPRGMEFVVSVDLTSAGGGTPDLQLFAMVGKPINVRPTERIESRRVQATRGALRLAMRASLGDGELYVGLRNLSGDAVTYTLRVQTCGRHAGALDPVVLADREVGPTETDEGRGIHMLGGDWFLLQQWEQGRSEGQGFEYRTIEITSFCEQPSVLLASTLYDTWLGGMTCGGMEPDGFGPLVPLRNDPWVHATRCALGPGVADARFGVFHCPVDGGPGEPLRTYSAATYARASLSSWPEIQVVDIQFHAPRDGNDAPSQAEIWVLDDASPTRSGPLTGIGETGEPVIPAYIGRLTDLYDFYRVVNGTDGARDVRITLTPDDQVPTGQTIVVEPWAIDPITNLAAELGGFSAAITAPPTSRVYSLPARSSLLVMIRVGSGRAYGGYALSATLE